MTAQARVGAVPAEALPLVRHYTVPDQLGPQEGQDLRVAGSELYWGQTAVHLDWVAGVLGVRYVGIVSRSWQPWAMSWQTTIWTPALQPAIWDRS